MILKRVYHVALPQDFRTSSEPIFAEEFARGGVQWLERSRISLSLKFQIQNQNGLPNDAVS